MSATIVWADGIGVGPDLEKVQVVATSQVATSAEFDGGTSLHRVGQLLSTSYPIHFVGIAWQLYELTKKNGPYIRVVCSVYPVPTNILSVCVPGFTPADNVVVHYIHIRTFEVHYGLG